MASKKPTKIRRKNPGIQGKHKKNFSLARLLVSAPLIFLCSLGIAAIMVFGSPALWMTEEQQTENSFPEGTEKEDYDFLRAIAEETGQQEYLVVQGEYRAISLEKEVSRSHNLNLAARSIDGREIKPHEEFSLNEVLGNINEDERYQIANTIDGYQASRGRGGGVGQVASALYIAALKADMEIIERHPHTVTYDYAPPALDATLAYGAKDLRIKNTSADSLYIRAVAMGQTVTLKIYGPGHSSDIEIKVTSEITSRFERDVSEEEALEGQETAEFCTAEAHRVHYKDGVIDLDEAISTDTYLVISTPAEDFLEP